MPKSPADIWQIVGCRKKLCGSFILVSRRTAGTGSWSGHGPSSFIRSFWSGPGWRSHATWMAGTTIASAAACLFSIRDTRSRPIAFGGRVLPQFADERTAKYINSPETPLFSKSRELYGLDAARDGIAREKQVVVLEGYTDCLMAHQHGLTNMVAVLGTALGEAHLQVLRRFTDSIVLVLDGDDAGRRRTNEIIDALLALFVKNQIDLRILTLPEGLDPCDFIASQGSDAFRHLLAGAVDALEHKFRSVTHGLDLSTDTHRATEAVEQVLATLAQLRPASSEAASPTLLREQQMLGRIAREFRLPEEQLRNRLTALRKARQSRPAQSRKTRRDAMRRNCPHPRNVRNRSPLGTATCWHWCCSIRRI